MLSISTPRKGADGSARYYTDDKAEYYLEGQGQLSHWFGHGAETLGLAGPVQRAPFYNLLNGYSPDGHQPQVQNAGHPDRQCCWDLTFSAPKSVSVLWALAPDDARQEIEQAHQRAVEQALEYVEEKAGLTRRGHGGKIQEQAELVFATFQEGASRALDPQLHTHAVLINLGLRRDGTTGSLKTEDLFAAKMKAGALYQARLADQLRDRLGLTLQRERVGLSVVGVPKELCRTFSKRRQKIEKVLQERGVNHAVAAKIATLDTRPAKEPVAASKLFNQWRQVAQAQGWSTEQARDLLGHARTQGAQSQPSRTHDELTGTRPTARENSTASSPQPRPDRRAGERGTKPEAPWPAHGQNHSGEILGTRAKPGEVNEPNSHRTEAGHRAGQPGPVATQAAFGQHPDGEPEQSATASAETRADRRDSAGEAKPATLSSELSQGDRGANSDTRKDPGNPQQQDLYGAEGGRRADQPGPTVTEPTAGQRHGGQPEQPESAPTHADRRDAEHSTKQELPPPEHRQSRRASGSNQRTAAGETQPRAMPRREAGRRTSRQKSARQPEPEPGGKASRQQRGAGRSQSAGRARGMRKKLMHVEWRPLFPQAPNWSPASRWSAPVLVLGSPKTKPRPTKWGRVLWTKNLGLAELRLQERRAFPNAPAWSPLHDLKVKVLRLAEKKRSFSRRRAQPKVKTKSKRQHQSRSDGHSQSQ
jgi:conjugative relaxase-like TrwC/TraI family protein